MELSHSAIPSPKITGARRERQRFHRVVDCATQFLVLFLYRGRGVRRLHAFVVGFRQPLTQSRACQLY